MNRLVLNNTDQIKKTKLHWFIAGFFFIFFSNSRMINILSIWAALICFLRFAKSNKPLIGFLFITTSVFIANIFLLKGQVPLPWQLYYPVCFIESIFFSIPFVADRLITKARTNFPQNLVFPFLFTLALFAYSRVIPLGNFYNVIYSQPDYILTHVLPLTGMWGIVFILSFTAAIINYFLDTCKIKKNACYWKY